jgi:uncharacterized membrane protein YdjX (TVP38/TMEM64 family)
LRGQAKRILVIVLFAVVPVALLKVDAVRGALVRFIGFLEVAGSAGLAAYGALYVGGAILVLPIWLLSGIAGYVYGFVHGLGAALLAIGVATTIAFGLGRLASRAYSLGDDHVARMLRTAVERHGFKATFLLRVAPIMPQNLLTYLLASTPLRFGPYFAATVVGLLPITLFHVYAGSVVRSAAALVAGEGAPSKLQMAGLAGGLVAGATVIFVVGAWARREMTRLQQTDV